MNYLKYIFLDIENLFLFKLKYLCEKILKVPFLFFKYKIGFSSISIPFLFQKDYIIKNSDGFWKIRARTDYDTLIRPDFEREFRKYFVLDGGTFIDIGTHIGKWSIFIAKQYKENSVISFEPNPITYSYLNENIILNKIENIKTINSGVGFKKGELSFHCDILNTGQSGISKDGEIQIQVNSLDNFLSDMKQDIQDIRLVKIDVEGFEWNVVQGMQKVLSKEKDITIICEIFSDSVDKQKILEYMTNHHFSIKEIDSSNYLFQK